MGFGTGDLPLQMDVPALSTVATNSTDDAWLAVPVQSDWNQATTTAADYIKNKPSIGGSRTFNLPTRSLNTAFQISTTQDAAVAYSVDITTSVSLSGGASGTVSLQYADDSGFTTNVKTVAQYTNANTGTLVVGLVLNQIGTASLSAIVPSGKYVRIRTVNNTGTPTYGTPVCQEVLL